MLVKQQPLQELEQLLLMQMERTHLRQLLITTEAFLQLRTQLAMLMAEQILEH